MSDAIVEAEQEAETPQGPASERQAQRRYVQDRDRLSAVRQWFAPLPRRPKLTPLTSRAQIRERLNDPVDEAVALELLDEAKNAWNSRDERARAAEAKATTLLGTVAIAAGLVIAGSGLILDPAKVADVWREVLMVFVALLLVCLLLCGYVASRALMKIHTVSRPQIRQALQRGRETDITAARVGRAVDLFARAGENLYIADYKLVQVRVAYRWYCLGLACFLAVAIVLTAYVLFGTSPDGAQG